MGQPAATANHIATGTDTHIVMVPSGGGPVPTPLPHPFQSTLDQGLAGSVKVDSQALAVQGSGSSHQPTHLPTPPGTSFQKPPANSGSVFLGSQTVTCEGKPIARHGDQLTSCNDPADLPAGQILAMSSLKVGP